MKSKVMERKYMTCVLACRVYCQQLRPALEAVLEQGTPANRALFDLLETVHQLERHALRWCPSVLGVFPSQGSCKEALICKLYRISSVPSSYRAASPHACLGSTFWLRNKNAGIEFCCAPETHQPEAVFTTF